MSFPDIAPLNCKMALALLTEEEQIKFIRGAQIEQEKLKLKSDQGKRLVPIFLDILNDAKDLEYDLYGDYFWVYLRLKLILLALL